MAPFIIFALPRSRTTWLSQWLAYGGRKVGHDIAIDCATPEEFLEKLSGLDGTVETGAMVAWRLIRARLPQAKFVTIRRPVEDVRRSLANLGVNVAPGELETKNEILNGMQRSSEANCWGVSFRGLDRSVIRGWMFDYLLGQPIDPEWEHLFNRNIQIDFPAHMKHLLANQDKIANLKRLAREQEEALCLTFA